MPLSNDRQYVVMHGITIRFLMGAGKSSKKVIPASALVTEVAKGLGSKQRCIPAGSPVRQFEYLDVNDRDIDTGPPEQ